MKTEVIMKRLLWDGEISQKSKSGFLSATDLVNIANRYRLNNNQRAVSVSQYLRLESTVDFINELEKEYGVIKVSTKGKKASTWVHPILFIDLALYLNPKLKLEVYKWLYDDLIKYRNSSGDSYRKMSGSIYNIINNKANMSKAMQWTALKIKNALQVDDWNTATEKQLELRDKIHNNISLLSSVLRNLEQVVDIAIKQEIGGLPK